MPGTRNKNWRRVIITFQPPINLVEDDTETIPKLINNGYVPVVGKFHPLEGSPLFAEVSLAKQLAALLAMKSVEMVFPRTKPAHPQVILEARDRLSDQLPAFWSAMFKLSVELRERIRDCKSSEEIVAEGQELVDTIVRLAAESTCAKSSSRRGANGFTAYFRRLRSPYGYSSETRRSPNSNFSLTPYCWEPMLLWRRQEICSESKL